MLELQQVVTGDATVLQRCDHSLPARWIEATGRADDAHQWVGLSTVMAGVGYASDARAAACAQRAAVAGIATAGHANAGREQLFEAAAKSAANSADNSVTNGVTNGVINPA